MEEIKKLIEANKKEDIPKINSLAEEGLFHHQFVAAD